MVLPINTIILVLLLAGITWLQVFLSKRANKWFGLVIPLICFISSIVPGIGVVLNSQTRDLAIIFASITPFLLVYNIPTLIFATIYFVCREKVRAENELDKMNIQDIE